MTSFEKLANVPRKLIYPVRIDSGLREHRTPFVDQIIDLRAIGWPVKNADRANIFRLEYSSAARGGRAKTVYLF